MISSASREVAIGLRSGGAAWPATKERGKEKGGGGEVLVLPGVFGDSGLDFFFLFCFFNFRSGAENEVNSRWSRSLKPYQTGP